VLATVPEAVEPIGEPTKSNIVSIAIPAVILTITEALTTTIATVDSTMAFVVAEAEDFTLVRLMGVSIRVQTLTGKASRIARILSRLNQCSDGSIKGETYNPNR
jgi:formylmethanofuran dehydrogenase subunit B